AADPMEGMEMAKRAIAEGRAWQKFRAFVEAQGGDVRFVDDPGRLPRARYVESVLAPTDGYIQRLDAAQIGMAVVDLGGGREKKEDPIDHAVGVVVHHKVGDKVRKGIPLVTLHANDQARLERARQRVLAAYGIGPDPVPPLPLFYRKIA
ncbi:MAG: pyrimidine-nucleoside phosphorylase, partial [Thermoflexia bacterium]